MREGEISRISYKILQEIFEFSASNIKRKMNKELLGTESPWGSSNKKKKLKFEESKKESMPEYIPSPSMSGSLNGGC